MRACVLETKGPALSSETEPETFSACSGAKGRIAILLNTKYIVAAPFSMAPRDVQTVYGSGFGKGPQTDGVTHSPDA